MAKDNLVPIKVKIRYGVVDNEGRHIYPNFNQISHSIRKGMDWSIYLDRHGIGWHYDKLSGIGEVDAENTDPDVWWGCTCVPEDFADAAVALFPDDVEVMNEAQFEDFYEKRSHIREPEEFHDADVLNGIKARRELGLVDNESVLKALDPADPTLGVRKNLRKKWSDWKSKCGVTIDAKYKK